MNKPQVYQRVIDKTIADCYMTGSFNEVGNDILLDCICRIETLGNNMPEKMLPMFQTEAVRRGIVGTLDLVSIVEENLGLEPLKPSAEIELPTGADLAFINAEADKIAEQFDIPAGNTLPMEDVASILALPEGNYLMRMCMYVDGKDFEGEWQPKDLTVLAYTVKLAARKGIGFSVQFKEV